MTSEREYEVGYGRPPKQTRFQKGRSGNGKGRPRGTSNLATILGRILERRVWVTMGGKKCSLTIREALVLRVSQGALSGDTRLIGLLFENDLFDKYEPRVLLITGYDRYV